MEHQKIICMLGNTPNQPTLNSGQKIELKQMVTQVEITTLIVKLNLKLQC